MGMTTLTRRDVALRKSVISCRNDDAAMPPLISAAVNTVRWRSCSATAAGQPFSISNSPAPRRDLNALRSATVVEKNKTKFHYNCQNKTKKFPIFHDKYRIFIEYNNWFFLHYKCSKKVTVVCLAAGLATNGQPWAERKEEDETGSVALFSLKDLLSGKTYTTRTLLLYF